MKKFCLVAVLTLLLFEGVLQVLSLIAHVWFRPDVVDLADLDQSEDARTLICVGDSFTYGFASSDPETKSYPAQLEKILEEQTSTPWNLINLGYPGNNSQQMGERLGETLGSVERADLVVILGGINDFWSGPVELGDLISAFGDPSSDGDRTAGPGFRWEIRTLRLAKTFGQKNPWASGEATSELRAEAAPLDEQVSESELATSAPLEEAGVSEETAAPEATMPDVAESKVLGDQAWKLAQAGQFEEAAEIFARLQWDVVSKSTALIHCHAELGNRDTVREQVDLLKKHARDEPSVDSARGLLEGLGMSQLNDELLQYGEEYHQLYPEDFHIAFWLGKGLLFGGDAQTARKVLDHAAELLGDDVAGPNYAGWFWRNRTNAYRGHPGLPADPGEMYYCAVCSYLGGESNGETLQILVGIEAAIEEGEDPLALFESALDRAPVSADQEGELRALFARSKGDQLKAQSNPITSNNLARMTQAAKQKGAKVLLISYPFFNEQISNLGKAVSLEEKTLYLTLHNEFSRREAEEGHEALYAPDGHCNDTGYRFMAELIADKMVPQLGAQHQR